MLKSFFNWKNKKTNNVVEKANSLKTQQTDFEYGLSEDNPILVESIKVGYSYLNALCSIKEGLKYERIGSFQSNDYPERLDKYNILFNGSQMCVLFIYAYHSDNVLKIPPPFFRIIPEIDTHIFDNINLEKEEGNDPSYKELFYKLIELNLIKNNIINDDNVLWDKGYDEYLLVISSRLGFDKNIEREIVGFWTKKAASNEKFLKSKFISEFYSQFHNISISEYIPSYIKERNKKIEEAYYGIIETINRIQAWLDNEVLRIRIESELSNIVGEFNIIRTVSSHFCNISLECDPIGRYYIKYNIDTQIIEMISNNMASTLIRRIYDFTPGEMEPFVEIGLLNCDCRSYFEELLKKVEFEKNHKKVVVTRNEEKSINNMLSKIELKDDISDEDREWFNK